jgi:competence protein ComEA
MRRKTHSWWAVPCLVFLSAALLLSAACSGGLPPLEISQVTAPQTDGTIYIDGAVSNPGYYDYRSRDTLADLLGAAGATANRDNVSLELYVAGAPSPAAPQKINLNRADAWLLEALPGVGEVTAARIIAYRTQHGTFHNVNELTQIEGIGPGTYENIKDLVTVGDSGG